MVVLADIQAALTRIRDQIYLSPCARSETLSRASGANASLKLENLQMTGAYKERGALNKLLAMPPAERARGLVAASAGNHAQAVAYHGVRLGLAVTIVMPETTPITKVANTRAHGARDEALSARRRRAVRLIRSLLDENADEPDLARVQRREGDGLREASARPEHRGAVKAFLEKRAPGFASARAKGTAR